ncbi:hypothetical protein I5Q34_13460 [Streptomyces sp. AV19]|uniref:hypothetical protein n=1 Tax=Streptomyces sp. AV19 TaxID=2793068 RepID=UPI0018FE252E|nr:hypothetical protein [Streptomyces sp. AV19]MBH1935267.1 hypothetical protein [Streptomyces sp. AV19]MDG4531154.1 hypothetical protein [Streptomyces sp. AV19]
MSDENQLNPTLPAPQQDGQIANNAAGLGTANATGVGTARLKAKVQKFGDSPDDNHAGSEPV